MTREEFSKQLLSDCDLDADLNYNSLLAENDEWDSLAVITTISSFHKYLKQNVSSKQIAECKTWNDILNLGTY